MPTTHSRAVLDLRNAAQYDEGHVAGAYSLPWLMIDRCCAELPPRHVELCLITDADETAKSAILRYFAKSGYTNVTLFSDREVPCSSRALPSGHCWLPNPFLEQHLASVTPGLALDVGSGAGRDVTFLASRGWAVIGFDNRGHLASRCHLFASRHGVAHRTGVCVADARRTLPFRQGSFDLIHVCRFIHRPLIPALAAVLRSGGALMYSHFLEGCELSARGFPKDESGFFRRGELEALLAAAGFVLLATEQQCLEDGRPIVHVFARKP